MGKLHDLDVFKFLPKGREPPKDHTKIKLWIIFDVKMGSLRRKARLVAGGHMTASPSSITYSRVASKESVQLTFLLAKLNKMKLITVDVTNAYVNAMCREKIAAVAGPEFGDTQGRWLTLYKALYGLKSSCAAWHAHLCTTLR